MATDRSLATLLRALQLSNGDADALRFDGKVQHAILFNRVSRLIQSAGSLLTKLTNPANVILLTAQILTAPAIWQGVQSLDAPLQILYTFAYATIHHKAERPGGSLPSNTIPPERWITAVAEGTNDLSTKWKHLLVFSGLLLGIQRAADQRLLASAKSIEVSFVRVANDVMLNQDERSWWTTHILPLTIGSVFGSLSTNAKAGLHYETLVPLVLQSTFHSDVALNHGYFLSGIDVDVLQSEESRFQWLRTSATHEKVRHLTTSPLVGILGPLSQIVAFGIKTTEQLNLILTLSEDLLAFCKSLDVQWRQNKLSEIAVQEELHFLTEETRSSTLPNLWRLLQSVSFAIIVMLRSMLEAVLRTAIVPRQSGLQVQVFLEDYN